MLGPAYRWSDSEDMSVLFLRYGSVATVKRRGPGPVEVEINWWGNKVRGTDGSLRMGRRGVERWIAARGGPHQKRKPYVPSPELQRRKKIEDEAYRMLIGRPKPR
jgi:hypothetical protein